MGLFCIGGRLTGGPIICDQGNVVYLRPAAVLGEVAVRMSRIKNERRHAGLAQEGIEMSTSKFY